MISTLVRSERRTRRPPSSHPDPDHAVVVRPEMNPMIKMTYLATLGLVLGACVPSQHPSYLVSASDPAVGTRPPAYSSVTAGIRGYDVVEPLDWRELNRRVGPQGAPERGDSDDAARRGR